MPFTINFLDDGRVLEWKLTPDGATHTEQTTYTPRFYVTLQRTDAEITKLQQCYEQHPDVVSTEIVE